MTFQSPSSRRARARERLWNACCVDCDGKPTARPNCNLCGLPVFPGDAWDESHCGTPAALGGVTVGVAHRLCNQQHGNVVVTPMVAKTKRIGRKHNGITRPGMTADALPCGRNSKLKKTFRNGVVLRLSQSERHRLLMLERWGAP